MNLPKPYSDHIIEVHGEKGRAWLDNLPGLIEICCERWSIRLGEPFGLSYNYVAPGFTANGSPVVFKIGVINPELLSEIAALELYDGRGVVQLLESDAGLGAMLLERVTPGKMLSGGEDDEENTRILARQMRRIWRPLTLEQARPFPSLERWTQAYSRLRQQYQNGCGPFPARLFELAEGVLKEYLCSQGEIVLLHGDLHHDNILTAEREPWLVIDPKGVAGEREFEIGPMMYNPWQRILGWPDLERILSRRVDTLVEELGFDRQRLLGWGFVESVLSMLWSLEDHSPTWDELMPIAQAFTRLLRLSDGAN